MGTSKTYDPRGFRVPGIMQNCGTHFELKDHMVFQTQSPIFEMKLESVHVFDGSSWQRMFTGTATRHECYLLPRNTNHPLGRSVSPEQCSSLLLLDDLMRETVESDQVMDLLSKKVHHFNLFRDFGHTKPVCLRQAQRWNESQLSTHVPFRNSPDTLYIKTLGQRRMGDAKLFMSLYEQATAQHIKDIRTFTRL